MITSYSFGKTIRVEKLSIGMVVAAYIQDRQYTIPVKFLGMYRDAEEGQTLAESQPILKMQSNEYYLVEDLEDGRHFKLKAEYYRNSRRLHWGYSRVSFREMSDIKED